MKFETMYKKASKGLDTKDFENHIKIYCNFITIFENEHNIPAADEGINVWHIEQNMYKPKHQGGKSIKFICECEFWSYFNYINNFKTKTGE